MLLVLATATRPSSLKEIRSTAAQNGLRIPNSWNLSSILGRSEGRAVRVPLGWEITELGEAHLREIGVSEISTAALQVAADLRALAARIPSEQTREFVDEAIHCHEAGFYRSAIVMSWLGAVAVMYNSVHKFHLQSFNQEAKRVFGDKWKPAVTTDDIAIMKESDFLDRLVSISIIGKSVKEELKVCLGRRNACGHPNSVRVGANQSAAQLEMLLKNVFQVFV